MGCADPADLLSFVPNFVREVGLSLTFHWSWRHSWTSFSRIWLSSEVFLDRYLWATSLAFKSIDLFIHLVIICCIGLLNPKVRDRINIGKLLTRIIELLAKGCSAHIHLVLLWFVIFLDIWGYRSYLASLRFGLVVQLFLWQLDHAIVFFINNLIA